jgi:dTDP-4-dehydrorhamnose reductase
MVGHALADALQKQGKSAVLLDRAKCDLAKSDDIDRLFREHRPALLLNCAAHTKVDLCEDEPDKADAINGHAVGQLGQLAREHGTYLVHYSTDFVFDGKSTRPYLPGDPVNPISAYGRSKLLGETELQRNAPAKWLIIRTAWVYGRHGVCFPRIMVERGRGGHALKVVSDEIGSPTFTDDLAEATLALVDRDATGIVHVTNSGSVNRFDFARAAVEEFDVKTEVSPITTAEWLQIRPKQACRPAYSVLDCSVYEKLTGKRMRPWRDALAAYHASVLQSGSF